MFRRKATLNYHLFFIVAFLLTGCATVNESAELYGIKMKSESSAKDFIMKPTVNQAFQYSYSRSTMDNEVYAFGHLEKIDYLAGKISSIRVSIMNESKTPLSIEHVFASFSLITNDGERIELEPSVAFYPANKRLLPHRKETFVLNVAPYKLSKEAIRMVICSFGLGETTIVLLPRPDSALRSSPP